MICQGFRRAANLRQHNELRALSQPGTRSGVLRHRAQLRLRAKTTLSQPSRHFFCAELRRCVRQAARCARHTSILVVRPRLLKKRPGRPWKTPARNDPKGNVSAGFALAVRPDDELLERFHRGRRREMNRATSSVASIAKSEGASLTRSSPRTTSLEDSSGSPFVQLERTVLLEPTSSDCPPAAAISPKGLFSTRLDALR